MSEILTIDTGAALAKQKTEEIVPLPLFDDKHPMLSMPIPEYKGTLPDPIIQNLISRLKMTMKLYGGLGLSANQCGVFQRVFVIGSDQFQIACINPRIVGKSPSTIKESEGCLSYPGLYVKVDRPDWVEVEYTNENGELIQTRLDGVTARCFQHELDHMNGIRMVEHVGAVALQMARRKQEKIIKKIVRHKKK